MDNQNKMSVPVAIIIAGIVIAGAIFFSRGTQSPTTKNGSADNQSLVAIKTIDFTPVTDKDHILGDPNASIVVVTYTDLECPACKYFDPILSQMMDEYGKSSQTALVFRNFPIKELHSKAPKEAEAAECVAQLGGNQKYWDFVNKIYDVTPANNGLDPAQLPIIASGVGIDKTKFNTCLDSGKNATIVSADYNTGVQAGVQGTPTSFLVLKKPLSKDATDRVLTATSAFKDQSGQSLVIVGNNGSIVEIAAAFPYQGLKQIIDAILAEQK